MILKKLFLIWLFLISYEVYSHDSNTHIQPNNDYTFKTKLFGKDEGYNLKKPLTQVIDAYGTVWIGGLIHNYTQNQLNENFIGLFYFNGSKFQDIPLPDSLKKAQFIQIINGNNKNIIVKITQKKRFVLLCLNPINHTFTEIKQPKDIITSTEIESIRLFSQNGKTGFCLNSNKNTHIYFISENHKVEWFHSFKVESDFDPYYEEIINFDENILFNDIHTGVYLFNVKSKRIQQLKSSDLIEGFKFDEKIKIKHYINYHGVKYFKFNLSNNYYSYDESKMKWKAQNRNEFPFSKMFDYQQFYGEKSSLVFNVKMENGIKSLSIYSNKNHELIYEKELSKFSSEVKFASRDFDKEIFVFGENSLLLIQFQNLKVSSYLSKYSIRAIKQIDENTVLAATQNNGIREVNLLTREEKIYKAYLNGSEFIPVVNKGLFYDSNEGIYFNYHGGVAHIDIKTRNVSTYSHYPTKVMREKGNYIYLGTDEYHIMRFDKRNKTYENLIKTDMFRMEDMLLINDTIFCATHSGLLVYANDSYQLISNKNNNNYFLCIYHHPVLGILVGSVDGKVYKFNAKSKSLDLLFEDKMKASVATLLHGNNNDLWINTFKGFIHYNIKDSTYVKYGVEEGFSDNEANRLSALKMKNGNFLIGTIKGLNYFNPNSLSKYEISSKFRFNEIKYYSHEKERIRIISPYDLKNIKKIVLAPSNRSIYLSFGFDDTPGIFNDLRFKYRLNNGEWRFANDFGELFIENLAPDKYKLEIVAINQIEAEIGNPIVLEIVAQQFLYKTALFWIIIALVVALVVFFSLNQYIQHQKLKQYFSDKLIKAHIKEQAILSQKLHDGIGQKLLLAKNHFILHKNIPKEELHSLDDVIEDVRNISHDLHPLHFKSIGLKNSLENLVEQFQRNSLIYYTHEIEILDAILTVEKGIILFGIVQECLNNVEKHSEADACQVKVYKIGKNLFVEIKDNGKGFELTQKSGKYSLGLKTMKEKAGYLNANFRIHSKPEMGTIIELSIKIYNKTTWG